MPRVEHVILDGGRRFSLDFTAGDIFVTWINAPEGVDRNIGRFGRDADDRFYTVPLAMDQPDNGDAILCAIAERAGIILRPKKSAP